MRTLFTRLTNLAGALLIATCLTACGVEETPIVTVNEHLDHKLMQVVDTHAQYVDLSALTPFEWDEFGFVPEGTTAQQIQDVFGEPVISEERYLSSPNLFIFMKDGHVVTAPMIILDRFDSKQALKRYRKGVTIGFSDTEPRHDLLYFTE